MTTYFYTLTLNDTEAITLRDALTKYIEANERNVETARRLIDKMYESVELASTNNFSEPLVTEKPSFKLKTDLFVDQCCLLKTSLS